MGGCSFFDIESGDSLEDAFTRCVEKARDEYGRGGYTGTIAEKAEVRALNLGDHWLSAVDTRRLSPSDAEEFVAAIQDSGTIKYDKWGPADGFEIKPALDGTRLWAFFGDAPD